MKKFLAIIIIFVLVASCKKETTTQPPVVKPEDFSFPPSSRFAISLITNSTNVNLGSEFDTKIVFYNVQEVFGSAIEIVYDNNLLSIPNQSKLLIGPFFNIEDTSKILILKKVENLFGRASLGISYVRNSGLVSNGSGVVFKIKFTPIARGDTWIKISKCEIRKSDGNFINNFSNIQIDSLQISIK
ncbi:MAG: hypothetical protein IGBAC_0781 [Ignavibacteriae bacterium]|nr:MAG: hypothetical protein IGBAC_0781 [Ignavibacteriota bacterium]